MSPKLIEKEILAGGLTPRQCAEHKVTLAGWYSKWSGDLEKILEQKPTEWIKMREIFKSDKSTDMHWDMSPLGQQEMKLRSDLKRIEKMMSGLSSLLRVHEGEARNQY